MRKKMDVDIYEELSKLVDTHVKHYKEDFDLDQRLIMQAAKAALPEDRTLIWFCRECGTHCLRESQAFGGIPANTLHCGFTRSRPAKTSLPVSSSPNP